MTKKATHHTILFLVLLGLFTTSFSFRITPANGNTRTANISFDQAATVKTAAPDVTLVQSLLEPPATQWNKTYGSLGVEMAESVQQTTDGGYIIAGSVFGTGPGGVDFWLIKADSAGNALWNKTYGGADWDQAYSVIQTSDGGYAAAGYTASLGAGGADFWLIKTDSDGNLLWNQTYGGPQEDTAECIQGTVDGGYVIAGDTTSFGAGSNDFWLVKTDGNGNMQWNKTYGTASLDVGYSVQQTIDAGFIIAGYTSSLGLSEIWLVKTDSSGTQQWNRTYGGVGADVAHSVEQTVDGGYTIAGYTNSIGAGGLDFFLIKVGSSGNQQWNATYGGANDDEAYSVVQTHDEGYALAGYTRSFGEGNEDFWIIKTDSAGIAGWNKTYGGAGLDRAYTLQQTNDKGCIVVGYTYSFDAGSSDVWLVKLAPLDVAPPVTLDDYDGVWHTSDFAITLTATDDASGVAETYYRINDGPNKSVGSDGQPAITTESASNKLEYWSIDNIGHEETHHVLAEIKLDRTAPHGSVLINNDALYTGSTSVTLTLSATDDTSGVLQVRYSNDDVWDDEPWVTFSSTEAWILSSYGGTKTVYYQIKDNAGLASDTYADTIVLDTTQPALSLTSPADAANISTSTVLFTAAAVDVESGVGRVELYLDTQLRGNMSVVDGEAYSMTVSALDDGDHMWYIKGYNNAGIGAATATRSFTIQTGQGSRTPDLSPYFFLAAGLLTVLLVASVAYYLLKKRKKMRTI